jgi:hypothetical protein
MKGIFMSRRKKKNDIGQVLVLLIIAIINIALIVLSRILIFLFDFITFYTTQYKEKSGYSFVKMYFDKGNYGEFILYRKMIRVFGKKSVLINIYLDNENTDLTEIDVLAISRKGIYIFEMKNYSGYIYGSEHDRHWTQVLNKWNKNKFYNPLRQNYAHTKAVENYLQVTEEILVPIIVFSNNSKLSKINISPNQNVFQYKDALKYVKNYEKKADLKISEKTKEQYLITLLDKCNMSDEVKLKHIEEVKELIKQHRENN